MENLKSSGIGGQAVIEGVMMKNGDQYAVAVRTPDGKIEVDKQSYESFGERHSWAKLPLIRGIVTFAESMSIGMKTLTYSASFYEEEEQTESKLEKAFSNVFKEKAETVVTGITVVIAILVAIGLFMFLPWVIAEQLGKVIHSSVLQAVVEGLLRLAIFILYVVAISMTNDIKRVYMYHGAEHKTINCVEQGLALNVENVRKQSREHKRCGTSFLLYVMIISIVLFMFIRVDSGALRIVLRVALVPVIAGISYEYIRFMGNHQGTLVNILSRPGFWMQGLTTREPDDKMIEVAIASVEAVFDWKGYVEAVKNGTVEAFLNKQQPAFVNIKKPEIDQEDNDFDLAERASRSESHAPVAVLKKADKNIRRGDFFHEPKPMEEEELSALDHTMAEEVVETQREADTSVAAEVPSAADSQIEEILPDDSAKEEEKATIAEEATTVEQNVVEKQEEPAFVKEELVTEEVKEVAVAKKEEKAIKKPERKAVNKPQVAALKRAAGVRRPLQPIEELRRDSILIDSAAEDDDEILNALDKFFDE